MGIPIKIGETSEVFEIPCPDCGTKNQYDYLINFKKKEFRLICKKCNTQLSQFKHIKYTYAFKLTKIITREDLNRIFGTPVRAKSEPYNIIPVEQLRRAFQIKESVWWCDKCKDFHTSTWNCIKSWVVLGSKEDENTTKLRIILEEVKT
jgi:hypothetical protein